jgi:hypothetical protein
VAYTSDTAQVNNIDYREVSFPAHSETKTSFSFLVAESNLESKGEVRVNCDKITTPLVTVDFPERIRQ